MDEQQIEKRIADGIAASFAEREKQAAAQSALIAEKRKESQRRSDERATTAAARRLEAVPRWVARGKLGSGVDAEISHIQQGDLVHVRLPNGVECWAHKDELTDVVNT